MTNTPSARLTTDEPASTDGLGTHSDVAAALTHVLRTEAGGSAIALEGDWGSGKSTVVQLVRGQFNGPGERLFIFDAWAHQGDPLRRSFLESLVAFLKNPDGGGTGWVSDERVEAIKNLSGRNGETSRKTETRFGDVATYVAASAIFVPIGLILLRQAGPMGARPGLSLALGLLLSLAPVLVAVVGWGVTQHRGKRAKNAGASGRRITRTDQQSDDAPRGTLFGPLVGNQSITEHTESRETIEPTSVEFENAFRTMMDEALSDPARHLAIVLDNLDRVAPDNALAVLATMQTFVGTSEQHHDEWRRRLWVIVPYDAQGLRRLWDASAQGSGSPSTPGETALAQLAKLFRVTFRVPPMRLTDWRKFLQALLEESFPDAPPGERELVPSVYSAYRREGAHGGVGPPTPRLLKQLVNDLVALRLQRNDIELPLMTYFALLSRYEGDVESAILSEGGPSRRFTALLGDDMTAKLAALHLGREVSESMQLILADRIEDALTDDAPDELDRLAEIPGMWDVAEYLPFTEWWDDGGQLLCEALATLSEAQAGAANPDGPKRVRAAIGRTFQGDVKVTLHSKRAGRGLATLAGPHPVDHLLKMLDESNDPEERDSASDTLEAIAGFVDALPASSRDDLTRTDPLHIAVTAEGYLEMVDWLVANPNKPVHDLVRPLQEWDQIDDALAERVRTTKQSIDRVAAILREQHAEARFAKTQAAITSEFEGEQEPAATRSLVNALIALDGVADETVTHLAEQGHFHHHFATTFGDHGDAETAAELLLLLIDADAAAASPPAARRASEGYSALMQLFADPDSGRGPDFVEEFGKLIKDRTYFHALLELDAKCEASAFVGHVLGWLADNLPSETLSADAIAEGWEPLAGKLLTDDRLAKAVEYYQPDAALERAALEIELNNSNAALGVAILSGNISDVDAVRPWVQKYLREQSTGDWEQAVRDADDRANLLVALADADLPAELDHRFEGALRDHIKGVAEGSEHIATGLNGKSGVLLDSLAPARRPVFVESLAGDLASVAPVTPEFVASWGEVLRDRDEFYSDGKALLLVAKCVTGECPEPIDWSRSILEGRPSLYTTAPEDHRAYLRRNLDDVTAQFDADADETLRSAVEALSEVVQALERKGES